MQTNTSTLNERIDSVVVQSPYFAKGKLRVHATDDCVIVEGNVDTYFHKQMAQETLLRIDGVRRIDNRVEVTQAS